METSSSTPSRVHLFAAQEVFSVFFWSCLVWITSLSERTSRMISFPFLLILEYISFSPFILMNENREFFGNFLAVARSRQADRYLLLVAKQFVGFSISVADNWISRRDFRNEWCGMKSTVNSWWFADDMERNGKVNILGWPKIHFLD